MRLPRITTRRWMVVVGVIAVGIAVTIQIGRWRHLARFYEIHAIRTERAVQNFEDEAYTSYEAWLLDCRAVDVLNRTGGGYRGIVIPYRPAPADVRRHIDYLRRMAKKYRRAARYPWLPVESDPPEPK